MYTVYLITNILDNKKYIGYTSKTLQVRFEWHCTRKNCRKLRNAIDKHGRNNFKIENLCQVDSIEQALEVEAEHIKAMDLIKIGYNLCEGGRAPKMSEETRQKMSKSHMGKKRPQMSQEQKDKIAKARIGIKQSRETILKGLETKKRNAKPLPADFGIKISERQRGSNNPSASSVVCVQTGEEFGSLVEAAKAYNLSSGGISQMLNGRNKTVGKQKYTFEYIRK
jgi:group I intron endonuclease